MIISHTLNTATRFLLFLGSLVLVTGCASFADPQSSGSQTLARLQAEPAPDRLVRYCRRMAETNNLRIAIGICERALAAAPENPEPVIILADAYRDANHTREAADAYRFALSIDQQNGKAHFELGKLYLQDSQLEEARPHLEAALANGQEDPAIFNALGVLEDQSGDHTAAQAFYQAGLALDPNNSALTNNLGVSILLSKPSEIGNEIFGQLPPEPDPSVKMAAAKNHRVDESLTSDKESKEQAVIAETRPALVQAPQAATLIQTEEESLLGFFADSRLAHLDVSGPLVTPAPVAIVDFQSLPEPPAAAAPAVQPTQGSDAELARALLDYNPGQTDQATEKKPEETKVAMTADRDKPRLAPSRSDALNLAEIKPVRKPAFAGNARPDGAAPSVETANLPESTAGRQIAMVPHLPLEMPAETPHPDTEAGVSNRAELTPDTPIVTVTRAAAEKAERDRNPLASALRVIQRGAPHDKVVGTLSSGRDEILTDVILPTDQGLSLLEDANALLPFAAGPSLGWADYAALYDGVAPTEQLGPTDIPGPNSDRPGDDPILLPDGFAGLAKTGLGQTGLGQTSKQKRGPRETEDIPMALMLLSRNAVSTA